MSWSLRPRPRSRMWLVAALATLLVSTTAHAQRPAATPSPLAVAPPESGGMSAMRLARLTTAFGKEIEDKKLPVAMILVEDGRLQLTDPVAKWLPAFKDVKVSTEGGEVPAQRPMTVQDLLRHTAGLPYGELGS
jgi:hypothetical protein